MGPLGAVRRSRAAGALAFAAALAAVLVVAVARS
jgi:hypothetical protein